MTLTSKRVVIVGGSSGIGLATARAAAEAGADVLIASSRQSNVDRALDELPAGVSGRALDVTDEPAVQSFFGEVGDLDHLVYTAGDSLVHMPLSELNIDRANDFFKVRYLGALTVVAKAAPRIRVGGSITLTSGMAGTRPRPGRAVVASLCGAIEALTRALAVELAPLRVNAIAPGVVRTPLWADLADEQREQLYATVAESLLLKHVGETDELARAYLYCMTQTFATGNVLVVDGGSVLA